MAAYPAPHESENPADNEVGFRTITEVEAERDELLLGLLELRANAA